MQLDATAILLVPQNDLSGHELRRYSPFWGLGHPWDIYWIDPLRQLFPKLLVYDYLDRITKVTLKELNKEVVELVHKVKPAYLIWPSVNYELLESTFQTIRDQGVLVVGFFFDDEFRFDEYSKYWAPFMDFVVTSDQGSVPKYRSLGAGAIYTLPCHGKPYDVDWDNLRTVHEVSFVGAKKYDREEYIQRIIDLDIPVNVFGPGWGSKPSFEEMIRIFQTSKINLNFSKTEGGKLGWKGRVLQVIQAGGFLLTEHTPNLESFFEIGREIACFHTVEEMIDQIKYYLSHDAKRQEIARAGWQRAINEYTPLAMMTRIFTQIESEIGTVRARRPRASIAAVRMPWHVCKLPSSYYMNWGRAFLLANQKGLWRSALLFSLRYNPLNLRAWLYLFAGFLPSFLRDRLTHAYRSKRYR